MAAPDARRADTTDPAKTRKPADRRLKPVSEAAVSTVGEKLKEQGVTAPAAGGGTFLQARTANEVLKAQERRIRLQKLKDELVDRARAEALTYHLAREERDAWVAWPANWRNGITVEAGLMLDPIQAGWILPTLSAGH